MILTQDGFRGGARFSPEGAMVISQGRQPLDWNRGEPRNFEPRRCEIRTPIGIETWSEHRFSGIVLMGSSSMFQGLTPLAIDWCPSGAWRRDHPGIHHEP